LNNVELAALGTLYASKQLTGNIINVRDGDRTYKFTKLTNGNYIGPKGVPLGLAYTGSILIMQNIEGDKWTFRADGLIDKIEYAKGVTLNFAYAGIDRHLTAVTSNFGHNFTFDYDNIAGLVFWLKKVTDQSGQFTQYEVDNANGFRLKKYTDKAGQFHEYTYDLKGLMLTHKLPNFYSVTNTYDSQDRVATQTAPGGQISTFQYNGQYNVASRGLRTIITFFDDEGKPKTIVDGDTTTNYAYDGLGRKIAEFITGGTNASYEYDNLNRVVKKTTTGVGSLIETFGYSSGYSAWTSRTDARGNSWGRTLDSRGLVLTETGPTVGGLTPVSTWTYDGFGRVTTFTDPTGLVTQSNYGAMNSGYHMTSMVQNQGGLNLTTSFGYDTVGNVVSVTNPRGYTTTFTFDLLRRPLTKTDTAPFGFQTEWSYDQVGNRLMQRRLINGVWQTENWTYSPTNKVLTHTDFLGKVTTNTYDTYDRLATTTDAESRLTKFFYDYTNRLTSIIDANNVTAEQRTYTASGQLYQLTDARSNVTTYSYDSYDRKYRCTYPGGSYEQWDYDNNGNVTTFRSRSGDTIVSTFDALNRLATRTPQGQPTETFTYDIAGRILSVSTPVVAGNPATGSFSRGYDTAKRLTSETNPQSQVVGYTLDANGNVTKITYPDGYYVDKAYDELDRLTGIKLNGAGVNAASFAYDALSRRTALTYLNGTAQSYAYDYGNNLKGMGLTWLNGNASWSYNYNDVDEMTSQAYSDGSFVYFPTAGTVNYGTANSLNQYPTVDGITRTMNSDGCLTGDGTWTYTYDADNMLTQAAKTGVTVNYVYDPMHRNIRKDDGTNKTRYVYTGDHILCEYNDTTSALQNRYVYGFEADDPIIQVTAAGVVTYNSQDHIGSIVARTDSSGNALSKYKYSPFGESPAGSLSGTIFGFTGQRFDAETGLYHFKARYYDPVVGRFLQPDPKTYGDGLNLYAYVRNTPFKMRDPSGTAGAEAFFEPYTQAHFQTLAAELYMVAEIMNSIETLGGSMALLPMSYNQFRSSYSASKLSISPKLPNVSEGSTAAPSFVVSKSGTALIVPKGARDIRPSTSTHTGKDNAYMYEGGTMSVPVSKNSLKMKEVPMNLRITKPSDGYPNGYGKYEKPLKNGGKQNVDPYTNNPGNPNGLGTRGLWDKDGPHFGLHE